MVVPPQVVGCIGARRGRPRCRTVAM